MKVSFLYDKAGALYMKKFGLFKSDKTEAFYMTKSGS